MSNLDRALILAGFSHLQEQVLPVYMLPRLLLGFTSANKTAALINQSNFELEEFI